MSQYIINSSQNQCKTVLMELLTLCARTNFLNSGVYFALGTALLAHRGTAAVVCQVARNHKTMVAAGGCADWKCSVLCVCEGV